MNEMVLYSPVCPLNGCCEEEPASYCTKYQQNRKRRSEDVASTGRGVVRSSHVPWIVFYVEGCGVSSAEYCVHLVSV